LNSTDQYETNPGNIKEVLGQLTGPQQVAVRGYICARADIKDLEAKVLVEDANRIHTHYHGTNCAQTNES
jgi:hypothetical protein